MSRRHAVSLAILASGLVVATSSLHSDADAVRLVPAVQRYLERDAKQAVTTYRAFRRLEAEGMGRSAWLEAWTEVENGEFRYVITAEGGAESVRNRVLHKVLQSEQQAWRSGEVHRSALTTDNYDFEPAGSQTGELLKVLMKPRRKGKLMLRGAMFLAGEAPELVRVEGRATSNPSFWVKRVDIVRHYQTINGACVPVSVESDADLRFAGNAKFRMTYQYAHINGRSTLGLLNAVATTGPSR